MPAKNSIKEYVNDGFYHIYNRGVERRTIFQDAQDYSVFLSYLKDYLLPKDEEELNKKLENRHTTPAEKDKILKTLKMNNFADEISLIAYCLMPNHFHFLIKQKNSDSMDKFMNSLSTRYVMYFNKKYKRVGPLYEGVYKAVLVSTNEYLLHLSRYIHKQASSIPSLTGGGQPSSYQTYLGNQNISWVKPEIVLNFFSKSLPPGKQEISRNSYKSFVSQEDDMDLIYKLVLEE